MTLKARLAATVVVAALVAVPLVWQENTIASVRAGNRTLAAQAETRAQPAPDSHPAPAPPAENISDQPARDRTELERLRTEAESLRGRLEQARAAKEAAIKAGAAVEKVRAPLRPGEFAILDAREAGSATGEALIQSLIYAMRTGDTNRILELGDWTAEGAREEAQKMAHEITQASGEMEKQAEGMTFRVVRQVPLDDGDSAVIVEVTKDPESHRTAMRIRRSGSEWRLVVGKHGPEEVKLSEAQMAD